MSEVVGSQACRPRREFGGSGPGGLGDAHSGAFVGSERAVLLADEAASENRPPPPLPGGGGARPAPAGAACTTRAGARY